jgi:hypothetical protein
MNPFEIAAPVVGSPVVQRLFRHTLQSICIGCVIGSSLVGGGVALVIFCNYEILVGAQRREIARLKAEAGPALAIDGARRSTYKDFVPDNIEHKIQTLYDVLERTGASPFINGRENAFVDQSVWFRAYPLPYKCREFPGLLEYYKYLANRYMRTIPSDRNVNIDDDFQKHKVQHFFLLTIAIIALRQYMIDYDLPYNEATISVVTMNAVVDIANEYPADISNKARSLWTFAYQHRNEVTRDYIAYLMVVCAPWIYREHGYRE